MQTLRDNSHAARKKGCGCLPLVIGAVVLVLALLLAFQLAMTRSPLPMRIVASILAKAEPDPVVMNGISGSAASGYRIARIKSGGNVLEDVRLHTTGILRMIRKNEFIIREIHVGKARVTTGFLKTEPESASRGKPAESTDGKNNFYLQMDRLSLNDMMVADSLTGATLSIPKLEWTGFKAGKGKFDLGDIRIDSNMLTVRTSSPEPGHHRIEAALLPGLHKRLLKPIPVIAEFHHAGDRISGDFQAFDGALRITEDGQGHGKILIRDLDLAAFIDGPLPNEIHLEMDMPPASGGRAAKLLGGSFRLGHVPFTIQPADLTESAAEREIVATGKLGDTEFRCALTATADGNDMDTKPLLGSRPPMKPEALLARIHHNADINDLDAETRAKFSGISTWFRFADN